MTEREFAAYIAGFFDGEGCISFCTSQSGGMPHMMIRLSQKDSIVLKMIQAVLGYGKINIRHKANSLDFTSNENCQKFLKTVQPFVIVRKLEVDLAIELLSVPHERGRDKVGEKERERYMNVYETLRAASTLRREAF